VLFCNTGSIAGPHSEIRLPYPPYSIPALARPLDIVNLTSSVGDYALMPLLAYTTTGL